MSMQSHVYELGLRQGQCSDVKVGAFGRVYSLHRLFLIQSGFFRAMLCGGYAEDVAVSAAASSLGRAHPPRDPRTSAGTSHFAPSDHADVVSLHFDDPNISRAAFEYCIAHLYGGGPQLVLPYWASPSSAHPLSPAFTIEFGKAQEVGRLENEVIGPESHPATPRFLLSLLATSIYLNIPSITSQALTLVLCSVTPYTVSHYLRFAIGKGIERAAAASDLANEHDDKQPTEWDWELQGPVRTLDNLGKPMAMRVPGAVSTATDTKQGSKATSPFDEPRSGLTAHADDGNELSQRASELSLGSERSSGSSSAGLKRNRESFGGGDMDEHTALPSLGTGKRSSVTPKKGPAQGSPAPGDGDYLSADAIPGKGAVNEASASSGARGSRAEQRRSSQLPDFHYGLPADRIGEACACWLAQWGVDVLEAEEAAEQVRSQELQDHITACRRESDLRKLSVHAGRVLTGEVDLLGPSLLPYGEMPDPESPLSIPYVQVWSYPTMPSSWVRALISSDSFFVRSEWDRYSFAKRIVEMRRLQKERLASVDAFLWSQCEEELCEGASQVDSTSEGSHRARPSSPSPSPPATSFRGFGFSEPLASLDRLDSGNDVRFERFGSSRHRRGSISTRVDMADDDDDDDADRAAGGDDDDEDEREYTQLFSSGIYYTHMSFQELNKISSDLSPSTGRPYTPLSVLQAALWAGSELKNHVLSCGRTSRAPSLPTLDGDNEGTFDGTWAATTSLESSSGVQVPSLSDGNVDLGVSSSLNDFVQACDASGGNSSRKRGSASLQQPGAGGFGLDSSLSMQSLGGRGATPLLTGSSGGSSALLSKRYYLVPSDDTVRLGDGLLAICGQGSSSSSSAEVRGGGEPGGGRPGSPSATLIHNLGATGTAAVQLPNTIPLPMPAANGDAPQASNLPKKDRSHFFGIANAVATGRELGEKGARTQPDPRKPIQRGQATQRRDERGGTPLLRQFGGLANDGDDASGMDPPQPRDDESEGTEGADALLPPGQIERWTGYEPMRLGVEFFGVDLLPEKHRLYSPTFFYAGSIWNLYVQAIKKGKGIQLGIYLHRQSPSESLPQPSAPLPKQMLASSTSAPSDTLRDGASGATAAAATHEPGEVDSPTRGSRRSHLLANRFQSTSGLSSVGGDQSIDRTSPRPSDGALASNFGGSFAAIGESSRNLGQFEPVGARRDGTSSFLDASTTTTPHRAGGAGGEVPSMGSTLTLPGGTTLSNLGFASNSAAPTTPSAADAAGGASSSSSSSTTTLPRPSISTLSHVAGNVPIVALCPGGPAVYQTCPTPLISYRDPRRMLRAYFSIHCPSPFGNALTRFSSAPDYFSLSQSWGWKSSSLLGVAYLEGGRLGEGRSETWGTFRCVCTVGVV
ncbi:hypothetical protein ACQY0O_007321 [Thecaphora frezii]